MKDALEMLMGKKFVKECQDKGIIPQKKYFKNGGIVVAKPIVIVDINYDEKGTFIKWLPITP